MTEAEAKETTAAPSPKKHGSPTKHPPAEKPKVGCVALFIHPVSYPWLPTRVDPRAVPHDWHGLYMFLYPGLPTRR